MSNLQKKGIVPEVKELGMPPAYNEWGRRQLTLTRC